MSRFFPLLSVMLKLPNSQTHCLPSHIGNHHPKSWPTLHVTNSLQPNKNHFTQIH